MSMRSNDSVRNDDKQANGQFIASQYPFPAAKQRASITVTSSAATVAVNNLSRTVTPVVSLITINDINLTSKTSTPAVTGVIVNVT